MAVSEGAKLKESDMQFVVSKQNLQRELGLVQGVVEALIKCRFDA